MLGHRTTARGIPFLLSLAAIATALAAAAGAALAHPGAKTAGVPQILFPVIGKVQYIDDFGDPRGQGSHEGNDIMVPRRSPVIAVEDGKVKWWTTSARAGCMLYLYGRSGTTYLYIHLNNDRTLRNDNRGGCPAGSTFTVADGAKVRAGEQIAWSGDSGDADGNPHLHFEVHPGDGAAVSPFAALNGAVKTLFPARVGTRASVGLRGTVVTRSDASLTLTVAGVRWWPGGRWIEVEPRTVEVAIDEQTVVDPSVEAPVQALERGQPAAASGQVVTVFSRPAPATDLQITGASAGLVAARVRPLA